MQGTGYCAAARNTGQKLILQTLPERGRR
ncbi:uncharacterized protein METZ01_LOCUS257296, partial [marine metagenome]